MRRSRSPRPLAELAPPLRRSPRPARRFVAASAPRLGDAKVVKNRLHFDIHASGERTDPVDTRRMRVDAEATRLAGLGATITGALSEEGLDHYAVGMKDPEGNEFDVN